MNKPTLRALVLIAVFVLSEVAAFWLYQLWNASYTRNRRVYPALWEALSSLRGIVTFALMPAGMVVFAHQHMDWLVPPGD